MQTAIKVQQLNQTTHIESNSSYIPKYIFVLLLHDGSFVIGHSNNTCRRIASLNSGCNPAVKALSVNRILGIKEQNEERTLTGVVSKFCETYGSTRVIAV